MDWGIVEKAEFEFKLNRLNWITKWNVLIL